MPFLFELNAAICHLCQINTLLFLYLWSWLSTERGNNCTASGWTLARIYSNMTPKLTIFQEWITLMNQQSFIQTI